MIMKKSMLSRRFFLGSAAGVTVSLPLLEGFGPRSAKAQAEDAFRYAIFLRQGNGVVQGSFWPSQAGALTTQSMEADAENGDKAVSVLSPYASKLNIVHGIGYRHSGSGCGHADGCFQCLTASTKNGNFSNQTLAMGESLDWRISRELDPSGVEPVSLYAGATSSFLGDVILYRGPMERRAGERNPMNAYQRLFGDTPTDTDDPEQVELQRLALQRKSVNDVVRQQMQELLRRPELSANDRTRLDAHFSAIRDLEIEISTNTCVVTPLQEVPAGDLDRMIQTQIDLIVLAMACGKSHAATLCIGNGNDQTQYVIDGQVMERYHHISHRVRSDGATGEAIPNAELMHHRIDKKFAGYFKYLLDKLSSVETPTGTLLDEGVSAWFNDLADGPPHGSRPVPWVLAGGAAGALRTGQYIRGDYQINRMLNTIGAAVGLKNSAGAPLDDFGDSGYSKGHIDGLLS
jgi:hypothetical protein